jgi:WXG100 family type VII secretion target
MSSGKIGITPSMMRERAEDCRTEANEISEVIRRFDDLLTTMQEDWVGKASESYAERYTEIRTNFENARDLAEEIGVALDKTANAYEETDDHIANAFSG